MASAALKNPDIVPLEIKYFSKMDVCVCLRFTENYLNLGCLENYWFRGSNVKQKTSGYVDNYCNLSLCVTLISPSAQNAELTQQNFFSVNEYINAQFFHNDCLQLS